jgi:hypothetical protein
LKEICQFNLYHAFGFRALYHFSGVDCAGFAVSESGRKIPGSRGAQFIPGSANAILNFMDELFMRRVGLISSISLS